MSDSSPINGVAHVCVCSNDLTYVKPFYKCLLVDFFKFTNVLDNNYWYYCIGGRTGFAVLQAHENIENEWKQFSVGTLHHICWRAKSRQVIDDLYNFLKNHVINTYGGKIITKPKLGEWAPGYYYILFEDPLGQRLEVNHIPGKGLLALSKPHVQAKL